MDPNAASTLVPDIIKIGLGFITGVGLMLVKEFIESRKEAKKNQPCFKVRSSLAIDTDLSNVEFGEDGLPLRPIENDRYRYWFSIYYISGPKLYKVEPHIHFAVPNPREGEDWRSPSVPHSSTLRIAEHDKDGYWSPWEAGMERRYYYELELEAPWERVRIRDDRCVRLTISNPGGLLHDENLDDDFQGAYMRLVDKRRELGLLSEDPHSLESDRPQE